MTAPTTTEVDEHQAAQAALIVLLLRDIAAAWNVLDLNNPSETLRPFIEALYALVTYYGRASATIAANYYEQERRDAGITLPFRVLPASPPDRGQVEEGIRWATRGLWEPERDIEAARTLVDGVIEKAVLDTARRTTTDATDSDRAAKGWYRETDSDPCHFCVLLAIRGPVYRTKALAEFKPHNKCACIPKPFWGDYQPSEQVAAWKALYEQATKGRGDKALLWRRAYEGRSQD